MDARFYNSEDIDIQRLAGDLVNVYLSQGYQAQQFGNNNQTMVQLKKGGDLEAIIGMQAALSVTFQRSTGGTLAIIGQQRWVDKAAVGAVGLVAFPILWPLALTAGAGALRQASLGNQVLNVVDGLVLQQRPGVLPGPIPQYLLPQVQQQWGQPNAQPPQYYIPSGQATPPPTYQNQNQAPAYQPPVRPVPSPPAFRNQAAQAPVYQPPAQPARPGVTLHCPNCNAPYEAGDTFCSSCGRSLTDITPPASQPASYTNANTVNAAPTPPTYQPPKPTYQPPTPPAYQPPKPQQPATPPPSPVYYVPSQPAAAAPAPAAQPAPHPQPAPQPKKPEEPYYVPPVTQTPAVKPQPKVTMVPGKPHQTPPPPKQHSQKQYYVPSHQEAQEAFSKAQQEAASASTLADQPRQDASVSSAQSAVASQAQQQPVADSGAPWGTLSFESGPQLTLQGERAVVGRFDHDLGGIHPDVDLAALPASDTVSRVHATLEHIGESYQLTDLNSTNSTRVNGKRLEPDKPQLVNDGDTLTFGKITCTFKKA